MEQSSKTLTFVVPAYNMETYLERCVESLLSATDNSDIEVLIVDDGSSDSTPELADMYERRWPGNVRAIHQVNKGHGGAVNTGIANATGMYVKVVDADDWVDMRGCAAHSGGCRCPGVPRSSPTACPHPRRSWRRGSRYPDRGA